MSVASPSPDRDREVTVAWSLTLLVVSPVSSPPPPQATKTIRIREYNMLFFIVMLF
jgi:hypothetical protein